MNEKELDSNPPEQQEEQIIPSYEELKNQLSKLIEKARVKSGRSVDDIAYQMNIPVPNLVGMENGTAYDTMEKVFIRGYLINYAKALELDNSDFMELLNAVYIARENDATNQRKSEAQKPVQAYGLRDLEKRDELPLMKIIPPILITLVVIGGGFYWQLSSPPSTKPLINIEEQEIDSSELVSYTDEYQNNTEYDESTQQNKEKAVQDLLSFKFLEESWLEVIDSKGKKLAWQLFGPGQSATFIGDPPYSLVIGNARGTLVKFNDTEVGLLKFTDQDNVARLALPLN